MSVSAMIGRLLTMDSRERAFRLACEGRKVIDRARFAVRRPRWSRGRLDSLLKGDISSEVGTAASSVARGEFLCAHERLAAHFIARKSVWPLRAAERDLLVPRIMQRFPHAAQDAEARATRIANGLFDVLGYRGLAWGAPPDWHFDPVHGRRPPLTFWASVPYLDPAFGDHKVIWELNRHQHWLSLGRAYWLTGNPGHRGVFVRELESWIAANPPLTGVNWSSMLELAFRTMSWTWAIEFFSHGSGDDREPWLVDLLVALDTQLAHIAHNLSRYFSPNTHLSGEALALYAVSQALPELHNSQARAALGRDVLVEEAARQIRADGGHVELSAHYHRYSTDFYLLALLVARASGDPVAEVFERAARAQAEYLRHLADDNGQLPLTGDDDGGQLMGWCGTRPSDASVSLAIAAATLGDSSLAVRPAAEEVYWTLGPLHPIEERGARTAWPSGLLQASGYFVSRSADGDHLLFDAGPHGYLNGGHAHSDALSVVLSVRGQPLLIDPGTATYTMDPEIRNRFRATRMHNTVVIDDRDHVDPRGPFHWHGAPGARLLVARTESTFDFVEATHDAYEHASHIRSVLALHGIGWLVVDHILGDVEVEAAAWWHVHPSWSSSLPNAFAASGRLERLDPGPWGLYAPEYGRIEQAPVLRVTRRGRPPFSFAAFVPANGPSTRAIAITAVPVTELPPPGWVGSAFHISGISRPRIRTESHGDLIALVAIRVDREPKSGGPGAIWGCREVRSDAKVCVIRDSALVAQIDGSTVEVGRVMASAVHSNTP